MEDSDKPGQELAVDVRESNLVDAKVERQREEHSAAAAAEDQYPGEIRSEEKVPEDQNPNENGAEDHTLGENKQLHAPPEPDNDTAAITVAAEVDTGLNKVPENKSAVHDTRPANQLEPVTPNSLVKCSHAKAEDGTRETSKNGLKESKMAEDDESGTAEDQAAFMKELESFYRERAMEFKPPRFYGQPLNCLKLWRAVTKLGGYDRVTGSKLWRQVGESFHPPKTCTTVSWTFRIFYEKALLEYERQKSQSGELQLAVAALPEPLSVENEANGSQAQGSGRARRDAAARAMQGWHVQRLFGYGEVGEPIIKDKNFNNMPKREKSLKSIGSVKNKRPTELEYPVKAARTETAKQLMTHVADIGPPADWVKINVRETKDCFEVYALVPGLLREEVRVQSDPAGRLVITGQPEQPDNPWGITAFKKVVSLPARIDPLQTSAIVSLHGRLYVRVPFEQSNI
ncbi:AT-rich interactive domain-containing protein 5 [Camellia lanceoleosa]|uniref:AT-rich interactive domain-containing protein 5 n=1 Tax=Camellia lanceoleosa TaxID=1840588 RepID=A0ACC0GVT1_9ERIC|nr:AT-rich interactive domain-containing protein 5 [Camellia lanceoleosa]